MKPEDVFEIPPKYHRSIYAELTRTWTTPTTVVSQAHWPFSEAWLLIAATRLARRLLRLRRIFTCCICSMIASILSVNSFIVFVALVMGAWRCRLISLLGCCFRTRPPGYGVGARSYNRIHHRHWRRSHIYGTDHSVWTMLANSSWCALAVQVLAQRLT